MRSSRIVPTSRRTMVDEALYCGSVLSGRSAIRRSPGVPDTPTRALNCITVFTVFQSFIATLTGDVGVASSLSEETSIWISTSASGFDPSFTIVIGTCGPSSVNVMDVDGVITMPASSLSGTSTITSKGRCNTLSRNTLSAVVTSWMILNRCV